MAAEIARPIRLSVATPHEPSWAIVTTVQSSFPSWCSAAFKGIGPASRAASTATIGYLRSLPMAGSYRLRHAPQSSVSVVMRLRQDAMRLPTEPLEGLCWSLRPSCFLLVKAMLGSAEAATIGAGSLRYLFEDFALDTDCRELLRGADPVPVEPQVLDLLVYLIRNRERVVSRDDLLASVWEGRGAKN